jgi:seryl-tRNA synthetase
VPTAFADELAKRLFYISDEISDFRLIEVNGLVQSIEVMCATDNEPRQLSDKINYVIEIDILRQKAIPSTVVWRSDKGRDYHPHMFTALVERGIAFEAGQGQVGFGEPLITLMNYFDMRLKHIAINGFNAQEYQYPTLLATKVLEELDYFASFPHFVMFVTHLHNDIDVYRAFLDDYSTQRNITPAIFSYCRNLDYCLPPTMCYHTYHQLRDHKLDENLVVTSRGKSFRFESKYFHGLERLWDFTIREIVFLGTREFVLDARQQFMQQAQALIEELDLRGHCEVANDPFFVGRDTASKIFSQKLMELKYELRLQIDVHKSIAVGSFNFHDTFFGQRFHMSRNDDSPIVTGCVGFGLERLVYAFLCQHGLDEKGWPQGLAL